MTDDADAFLDSAINASRALVGIAVRAMNIALPEASLPVWRALWVLTARGPLRPSELADALNVSAATAGRIGTRLASENLAERYKDPSDARSVLVRITPKGQAALDSAVARQREYVALATGALPARQRRELASAFEAIYAAARDAGVLWP